MVTLKKILILPIAVTIISVMFFSNQMVTAAGPLDLSGVNNFALLANTYTNTGAGTILIGDLGYTVSPANPPIVSGITFTSPNPTYISAEAIQAHLIISANDPTQSGACTTTLTAATVLDTLPQPLTPGVYCIAGAVSINKVITLSGDGVYIFRMGGALNTVAGSMVKLAGGVQADNVFWVPVGATTLGANSVFAGNVLSSAAITVGTTVNMNGRILSNGAVTTGPLDTITAFQHSKDAIYLNIEKRVHGFSGAYVDENGVLNVYTTDHAIKSIAKSTLANYVEPYHLAKGIIVKHSKLSWHKWLELQNIVTPLAENKDLGITTTGVDDKNQVFRISFESLNSSKIDVVNKFLADHNISSDMVKLVETGKFILVNDDTMPGNPNQRHDYNPVTVNPITGGAEIGLPGAETGDQSYTPKCTIGFVVKISTVSYGLTAGHCQASGTQTYRQPYSTTSQNSNHIYPLARLIGSLIAGTVKTTNSDSLLFGVGTETGGFGKIYQQGLSQVTITGKAYTQLVGDTVCSSGAGSSSTRCGSLTTTGITQYANAQPIGHAHTNLASFTAIGGDSGSPVWNPNGGITVYGIVFAADSAGSYYSDVGGIEADQGVLQFK